MKDPRIVVFACSWYPLTAIDNAGEDGCQYAASTTVVPLECGGAVTTAAVLRSFAGRADGVLVAACGEGDCHYANGNDSCSKVVDEAWELMALAGLEPERLRLELSSSVDGGAFASLVEAFSADIGKLNGAAAKVAAGRAKGRPRSRVRAEGRTGAKAKRGSKRAPRVKPERRARGRTAA